MLMRLFDSRFGQLLLVAGLSSGATLALCILYVQTQGPPAFGDHLRLLSPADAKPPTPAILPIKDPEPRLLKQNTSEKWTCEEHVKNQSATDTSNRMFSHALRTSECYLSLSVYSVFSNHFALFIAVVVDVVWHAFYAVKGRTLNLYLREICLGTIVLNLFNNGHLGDVVHNNAFTFTAWFLCIEAAIYRIIDRWQHINRNQNQDDAVDDLSDLEAKDRYQLLSLKFTNIVFLFVCQLTLGLFYIYALTNRKRGWDYSSGWRWLVGLLLCNMIGEDEIGNSFSFPFWLKLLNTKDKKILDGRSKICFCWYMPYRTEVVLRMIMSMSVNCFIRRIVVCTAPILLSVVDKPLDFIKDSLAVFFITKLDELNNAVNFKQDLGKKKDDGDLTSCLRGYEEVGDDGAALVTDDAPNETVETLKKEMNAMNLRLNKLADKLENKQ